MTKSLSSLHIQVRGNLDKVKDGKVLNPQLGITLTSTPLPDEPDWMVIDSHLEITLTSASLLDESDWVLVTAKMVCMLS